MTVEEDKVIFFTDFKEFLDAESKASFHPLVIVNYSIFVRICTMHATFSVVDSKGY